MNESEPAGTAQTSGEQPLWRRFVAFIIALATLGIGILLLVVFWGGRPVATTFTRVGGQTRVETALEAARLWGKPPAGVVTIPGNRIDLMFKAASCAVTHNVPLLFTSDDPAQQRMVAATISVWKKEARNFQRWGKRRLAECIKRGKPDFTDLSTLRVSSLPPGFPTGVKVQRALARLVVFAAEDSPGDPPDVAVGLALAAHLAKMDRRVSLVVVPRYLQADLGLEDQLRHQRQVIKGGIVLGSPKVLPEDTRALLRQLLTAIDSQGFFGEVRTTLGSVEPLIAAVLALFGLGAAYKTAPRGSDITRLRSK